MSSSDRDFFVVKRDGVSAYLGAVGDRSSRWSLREAAVRFTREGAQEALSVVLRQGFDSARVVRVRVKKKPKTPAPRVVRVGDVVTWGGKVLGNTVVDVLGDRVFVCWPEEGKSHEVPSRYPLYLCTHVGVLLAEADIIGPVNRPSA